MHCSEFPNNINMESFIHLVPLLTIGLCTVACPLSHWTPQLDASQFEIDTSPPILLIVAQQNSSSFFPPMVWGRTAVAGLFSQALLHHLDQSPTENPFSSDNADYAFRQRSLVISCLAKGLQGMTIAVLRHHKRRSSLSLILVIIFPIALINIL